MGLYMLGFISYGATLVFYAALFPRLARNTPHARALREKYENGEISAEVYEKEESLEKNRISNISTVTIFPLIFFVPLTKEFSDAQQYRLRSHTGTESLAPSPSHEQPES